jgi:hypothetical protein
MILMLVAVAMALGVEAQQHKRDPLTDGEVTQMREAADYPNKRIELLVKFARDRVAHIDGLRSETSSPENTKEIHDLLEDFISILDEADDNVEMYSAHNADMRKGLKLLIEADSEWQLKLRQLKEKSSGDDLHQYSFVLTNAVDTVADSNKNARDTLSLQNKLAEEKKLVKAYTERKD